MKKIALLIALMLITAFTFAQVDVTVTGSSELIFGVNLDSESSGFTNTNSSKVAFTLGTGTSEKGAEEAVFGWIQIDGWKVSGDNEGNDAATSGELDIDTGAITAKVMFPGGWVKISGTSNEINYVNVPLEDEANTANDTDDKGLAIAPTANAGLVLGINAGPAAIEVGVFSQADYNTNTNNNYGASLKAVIDVAPAKIEVGVVSELHASPVIGFGGKVTLNVAPLTVFVGGDVDVTDSANVLYEVAGGVSVALMDGVSLGIGAVYNYATDDDCDVTVTFSEANAGGLVDGLGLGLEVLLDDIVDTNDPVDTDADSLKYVVELNLDYLIPDMAKPYVTFGYGTYNKKGAGVPGAAGTVTLPGVNDATRGDRVDANAYLTVGAELYMITNVVMKLEYSTGTLMTTGAETAVKGVVIFSTKISY